jgi:hypothetical protein
MLPPLALEALKFSAKTCNEAITVALSVDYDSGMCVCVFVCVFIIVITHFVSKFV